jgi:acetolactate synthase-1/2/3 large subunit
VFDGGFAIVGKLIRIDIDAQQAMRNFRPDVAIAADAKLALAVLDAGLAARPLPPRDAGWGAPRVRAVRDAVNASYDQPIRSQVALLDTVLDTLPDAVIVGDSTRPVYAGNFAFEAAAPRSWFNSSTGYGTLGYGLPAAIGARLATDNRPVICLIGDGGLQFTLPELASAVEAAVPVIVLLWNNRGYAEIRKYMVERDIEPIGVDIYTPDFLALARGFGCCVATAETPALLANELKQAAARRVPTLIEIDEQKWFDNVLGEQA